MPINFIFTDGSRTNCKEVIYLIKNTDANLVLANRADNTNKFLSYLNKQNMKPIISPKRNCLYQRDYEPKLYCLSYIIENTFLALKH